MSGHRKLTTSQLKRIRRCARLRDRLTNKALAAKYGVSLSTICNVIRGGRLAAQFPK
jgi:hypothetical protein